MSIEKEIQQAETKEVVQQPPYTPIFKMGQAVASAPKAHVDLDALLLSRQKQAAATTKQGNPLYVRGKTVIHVPTRTSVVILKCEGLGKAGAVEYLVVSKKGKKWNAKEDDLRPKPPKT